MFNKFVTLSTHHHHRPSKFIHVKMFLYDNSKKATRLTYISASCKVFAVLPNTGSKLNSADNLISILEY
jgi:hypothetical protein